MKVKTYSLDYIFEKKLLLLIPFYIFSHEKDFPKYNSNEEKRDKLKAEYHDIIERLNKLEQQGVIGAFEKQTIIDLSGDVINELAKKYENVKKGIGDIMRGPMIETQARKLLEQGISQGISQAKKETAINMLKIGKLTIEDIATCSELSIEEMKQLAEIQTV